MTEPSKKIMQEKQNERSENGIANGTRGKRPRKRFLRYEWFKCKKLGLKWRRPRGLHSKMRQGRKGKPPQVNIGYGNDASKRGLVNGVKPVVVYTFADLQRASVKSVIIARSLGMRAVAELAVKAKQLGIKILNEEKVSRAQHRARMIDKQRAERAKAKFETKAAVKHEVKPAVAETSNVQSPVAQHALPVHKPVQAAKVDHKDNK